MSDIFHEVEEEVRKERYVEIWNKYGTLIIAGAAAIIIGVAAYQAWLAYSLGQREQASARFDAAALSFANANMPQAETEFRALANDAPAGYQDLAKFRMATSQLAQDKRDEAIATLRELANHNDPILSAPARIRLAWTLADTAPRAEVDTLLEPVSTADSPWRFAATELRAYLDLQGGRREDAQASYERLANEAMAPQGLRDRARAIAGFLRANTPPGGGAAPAPATPAAPAQAAPAPSAPASGAASQ